MEYASYYGEETVRYIEKQFISSYQPYLLNLHSTFSKVQDTFTCNVFLITIYTCMTPSYT